MTHDHCHWTYTTASGYQSPFYWPDQAGAQHAAGALSAPAAPETGEPRVFQVHAPGCACEPTETKREKVDA